MTVHSDLLPPASKDLSPRRCCVVHGWILTATYDALDRAAQRERKSPDQVVAELVERVYGDAGGG